jgi:REP element-mobilizing transposase RayT
MSYDPALHRRRSIRLSMYDYSEAGAYFVTICTRQRKCLFGAVRHGSVALSRAGQIVVDMWNALPGRFPTVELDASVVMPNHLHGILLLTMPIDTARQTEGGATPPLLVADARLLKKMPPGSATEGGATPPLLVADARLSKETPSGSGAAVGAGLPRPLHAAHRRPTLGQIVAFFKYQSTRSINAVTETPGVRVWQRNYYEHVIRNDESLDALRTYVAENPLRWDLDGLHPNVRSKW